MGVGEVSSGKGMNLPEAAWQNLPEAAERFVAVWANPLAASELAAKLTNSEVWSLSDLLTAMGEPGIAEQWISAHAQN